MFDESGFFDPNTIVTGPLLDHGLPAHDQTCSSNNNNCSSSSSFVLDDVKLIKEQAAAGFSLREEELPGQHVGGGAPSMGLDDHFHHHLGFDLLEQDLHGGHLLMQEAATVDVDNTSSWMTLNPNPNLHDQGVVEAHMIPDLHLPLYGAATPDLLNLLHLRPTPAPALPFPLEPFGVGELAPPGYPEGGGLAAHCEALSVQLGYPAGPPAANLLRDLFQSLPQNYGLLYGAGGHEREALLLAPEAGVGGMVGGGGMVFGEEGNGGGRQFEVDGGVFEFRVEGKVHTTEKQRREQLGEKFKLLKSLVPNPTKNDRATTISDAINYIHELKRTVQELKILVDAKKHGWNKKRKVDDATGAAADILESPTMAVVPPLAAPADGTMPSSSSSCQLLRSSWIQRKTKETSLDVRIVDDEVTIKVSRRKRGNCLLTASRAIEELQLELIHVSGGHIGDCYVFLFNTKISKGCYVYGSAVAKKLLEVLDRSPYPALPARF